MREGGRAALTTGPRNWYLLEFEHSLYGPGKGAKDVGSLVDCERAHGALAGERMR